MKVIFKAYKYGINKNDVVAILTDNIKDNIAVTYELFTGFRTINLVDSKFKLRNATYKEFSSTKFALERELNSKIEIINRINL